MEKTEIELQFEYMERIRALNEDTLSRTGRRPAFFVNTFGCQMNERDSEKLAGVLLKSGYESAPTEEEADLIIFNTCTVRENANERLYGRLGVLKKDKEERPSLKIALCGCMMQDEAVVEKIHKSYPYVDLIFGTHNLYKFAQLLCESLESERSITSIEKSCDKIIEDLPSKRKYPFKSGVNIMFGCNNFCTYCIVPYVRGRERSRAHGDILKEIRDLSSDGVREIMLLGQNVNSYGKTSTGEISFAELLKRVCDIDGIERVRFMTSHPKDLSDELISVMASTDKIARHLHLPLQSGSSRILKAMNRHYTKEDYLKLVDKIRNAMPDIAITTDLITGFPTEEEADVDDTIDCIEKAAFEGAFTFEYSKRKYTAAAEMDGQIPKEVVRERFDRVLAKVRETGEKRLSRFTGQILPVMTESINERDPKMVTGKTSQNITVHFKGSPDLIGKITDVKMDECRGFYYTGSRI